MAKKGRGWHGEPVRHSKAARGIKTVTESRLRYKYSAAQIRFLDKEVVQLFRIWNNVEGFDAQHTQLDWMTPRELLYVLDKSPTVTDYNDFDVNELAKALSNTRGIQDVKFGREYSPILYIRTEPGMYESVLKNFRRHMKRQHWPAEWDEEHTEKFGERVIRAWWD